MAWINIPPLTPVPPGATQEERRVMFEAYKADLRRLNQGYYNADGSLRPWWRVLLGLWTDKS